MERHDPELGERVRAMLLEKKQETPSRYQMHKRQLEERKKIIAAHFVGIMQALELDLTDDSLIGTPDRIARMYLEEIFSGLCYENFPACTVIKNTMSQPDEFVLEEGITVHSTCEHHFVVIDGIASVAYVPKDKVLGLSKLNRIVNFFCKRPQVQERLTRQAALTVAFIAECDDVAVLVDAVHHCVKSRGIMDQNSRTTTFAGLGRFSRPESHLRRDFLARTNRK